MDRQGPAEGRDDEGLPVRRARGGGGRSNPPRASMRQAAAARVASLGTTVFSEFSALAQKHDAVNLGQGFPDFDGPDDVKDAAIRAISTGVNQYAIGSGSVDLRAAISEHQK